MGNKFANALKSKQGGTTPKTPDQKQTGKKNSSHYRPSRDSTKHVGGYYDPAVSKQMRQLALNEDSSVQELLAEAIDMLFQSRQMPTIAQQKTEEVTP